MALPSFQEKLISQLPAVALLQNLGYEYLSPEKAVEARGRPTGQRTPRQDTDGATSPAERHPVQGPHVSLQ